MKVRRFWVLVMVLGLSATNAAFAKPNNVYKPVTAPKSAKYGLGGPAAKKNNSGINGTGIHSNGINGTQIQRRR